MSNNTIDQSGRHGELRVDHVETSGVFALDGGEWEVDNNIWIVGDDAECIIIDCAHQAEPIVQAVDGRRVRAIVCTHGHNDHITVAPQLSEKLDAPILLNPADDMLWKETWPDVSYETLSDGQKLTVAGTEILVIGTPGHTPGSCCLYVPELGVLFSGDTLFSGGPGATGRSYSSFDTIIESIREKLLTLPADTVVNTGHGDSTTIGTEAPHLDEWISRGY